MLGKKGIMGSLMKRKAESVKSESVQSVIKKIAILTLFLSIASPAFAEEEHSAGHESKSVAAHHSEEHASEGFDLGSVLSHHLMDSAVLEWNIGGKKVYEGEEGFHGQTPFVRTYTFHDEKGNYRYEGGIPMHLTRRVTMMWVVSIVLIAFFVGAAQYIKKNPYRVNGRFAGLVESLVQFVRDDIAESNMHHHSKGYQPYLLTVFFFILFGNLLGLFPPVGELLHLSKEAMVGGASHGGGHHETPFLVALWPGITITGDVAVTLTLALITTVMIWVTGFRYQGVQFLWHVVPNGVPVALFPLMWFLEFIVGPLAKGFALTIRLLANMTGGHVIILVLIGFIFQFKSLAVVPVSVVGATIIYMLEIFVAFLQAFIFALLSALFMGQMMHRH